MIQLKLIWIHPEYTRWTRGREYAADGSVTLYLVLGRLMVRLTKGER